MARDLWLRRDTPERCLQALCSLPGGGGSGWCAASWIAITVNPEWDGRKITRSMTKLVGAGLVELGKWKGKRVYRPTDRGREIDALLDKYSHDRGGKFRPRLEFMNHFEAQALLG